jgi:hypothetical protein
MIEKWQEEKELKEVIKVIMVEFTVLDLYHEVRSLNSELETK